MFQILNSKLFGKLEFRIWNLFRISNFEFRILIPGSAQQTLNYEKKISQEYKKVYQEGEGSDSPGSFRFERTREANSTII
jgi:hypothetical protein